MGERLQEIQTYWNARSDGFSEASLEELENESAEKWREIFGKHLSESCRVLDDGAGAGFFTILLAEMGHHVTAVDYSPKMLRKVSENLKKKSLSAEIRQMDVQELAFEDETFDAVVSRDVFWCLEHPEAAYREAARVLKPGGILILKDGNYYRYLYDQKYRELRDEQQKGKNGSENAHCHARHNVGDVDFSVMEKIAEALPLSRLERPQYDLGILIENGFRDIRFSIQGKRLPEEFLIFARKDS